MVIPEKKPARLFCSANGSPTPFNLLSDVARQSLAAEKLGNHSYHEWDQHPLLPTQGVQKRRCGFRMSCPCGLGIAVFICNSSYIGRPS